MQSVAKKGDKCMDKIYMYIVDTFVQKHKQKYSRFKQNYLKNYMEHLKYLLLIFPIILVMH